jgi:hypothetical protein
VPIPPVTANSIASIVPPIQIVSERGVVIETTGFGVTITSAQSETIASQPPCEKVNTAK